MTEITKIQEAANPVVIAEPEKTEALAEVSAAAKADDPKPEPVVADAAVADKLTNFSVQNSKVSESSSTSEPAKQP